MPRIRSIKPEFFTSEQVVECSTTARLLFVGLWCFCDDGGVHPASVSRLKMEVFPADPLTADDVKKLVDELVERRLIESYSVDGKDFWRVTGWHHQKIEKPTYTYPRSREFGEHSATIRRGLGESSPPESSRVERSREESKGKESKDVCGEPAKPASPPPSPGRKSGESGEQPRTDPVTVEYPQFPCLPGAAKKPDVWLLTEAHLAELARVYPGVDVAQESQRAHLWIRDNLGQRKTFDGMRDFLSRWMKREQNSGRGQRRSPPPGQRGSIDGL